MDRIREKMGTITVPLLILHGTADRLTNPKGSRMLYERAGSADKTLRLYEGLRHDLFMSRNANRLCPTWKVGSMHAPGGQRKASEPQAASSLRRSGGDGHAGIRTQVGGSEGL